MYFWRASAGPVDLAFTDRFGGVSAAPYAELNLARGGDDDEAARARNHRILMDDFAPDDQLVDACQVHGATIHRVEDTARSTRRDGRIEADGLVATRGGVTLMVRAADCVPVLLADPGAAVVAAIHSGRSGMVAGVATAAVRRMREVGAHEVTAWIGPHICGRCYEVPEEMREEVCGLVPAAGATTSWGTPALDIGAGVRAQLEAEGCTVTDVSACTRESESLYSHRRDGAGAGRLAGLIRMRP